MHSPHSLPGKSSPHSQALSVRALTAAIALSAVSCASIQTRPVSALAEPITTEMTEGDIDNPVFIALVSIGAEIQA